MEETITHPELTAEIPGVELELELMTKHPIVEDTNITEAQEAMAAAANTNIEHPEILNNDKEVNLPDVPTGVDEVPHEEMFEAITEEDNAEDDAEEETTVPPPIPTNIPTSSPIPIPITTPNQRPQRTHKKPEKYNPSTGKIYEEGVMHINTTDHKAEPMNEEEHM